MYIYDSTRNKISLTNSDFIASGGEGSIYRKNNLAYKIYNNPKDCLPIGKINELSVLNKPNIINPKDIIKDSKDNPIGYVMPLIQKAIPLCKLFVRSFFKKQNISDKQLLDIILQFRSNLEYVHNNNILVVDLNEMNFLFNKNIIIFIDTDSYQTKSYPAKVIMENIRDWSVGTDWNQNSDWYSWGIITHQIFTGIHPFAGSDPNNLSLKDRMISNLSVFDKKVKIPRKFKDRSLVPAVFEDWYKAIFKEGKRLPPPSAATVSAKIQTIAPTISTDKLQIIELTTLKDSILRVLHNIRNKVLLETHDGVFNTNGKKISEQEEETKAHFYYKGTKYTKEDMNIFREIWINQHTKTKQQAIQCMPYSTHMYNGIAVQIALNTPVLSIFPTEKTSYSIPEKSLKEYRIIDAKFESKTIILLAEKAGKYTKFIYLLDKNYQIVSKREIKDIQVADISFAVTDKGIVAHILEDEVLELFGEQLNSPIKHIKDPIISTDMNLFSNFNEILFSQNNRLYRMKTK